MKSIFTVKKQNRPWISCNGQCVFAIRKTCECPCKGQNHQIGDFLKKGEHVDIQPGKIKEWVESWIEKKGYRILNIVKTNDFKILFRVQSLDNNRIVGQDGIEVELMINKLVVENPQILLEDNQNRRKGQNPEERLSNVANNNKFILSV